MSEITRRRLLGRTAAGVGAAATVTIGATRSPRFSPVGRADAAICGGLCAAGLVVGAGAAITYFGGKGVREHFGDDRDYSGYTGSDALHNEIAKGALEMQSADERVMTGIENNIEFSQNAALAKGKAAIIEQMNAGNSESEATNAMQEAIDGYYATIQENILTHWKAQYNQLIHHAEQVRTHADFSSAADVIHSWNTHSNNGSEYASNNVDAFTSSGTNSKKASVSVSLIDDSTVEDVPLAGFDTAMSTLDNSLLSFDEQLALDHVTDYEGNFGSPPWGHFGVKDPEGSGEYISYLPTTRYRDAWAAVPVERDSVNADLSGFVSDVYSNYDPGDIPTEDLVDPITAATELSQNYTNRWGMSAHAAMLGIPTGKDHTVRLEIEDTDADDGIWEITGDLFTEHVPTDTDGNKVGFEAGKTYDPGVWDAPVYVAFDYVDETTGEKVGEFAGIEEPFTIVEITDGNGESVDSFQTTSLNNQTADVSTLEAELQALREAWLDMQEDAQEGGGGGDSDFWDWGLPGPMEKGIALVGGAIGASALVNASG